MVSLIDHSCKKGEKRRLRRVKLIHFLSPPSPYLSGPLCSFSTSFGKQFALCARLQDPLDSHRRFLPRRVRPRRSRRSVRPLLLPPLPPPLFYQLFSSLFSPSCLSPNLLYLLFRHPSPPNPLLCLRPSYRRPLANLSIPLHGPLSTTLQPELASLLGITPVGKGYAIYWERTDATEGGKEVKGPLNERASAAEHGMRGGGMMRVWGVVRG